MEHKYYSKDKKKTVSDLWHGVTWFDVIYGVMVSFSCALNNKLKKWRKGGRMNEWIVDGDD